CSEAISFIPEARAGHVSIIIGDLLYFMGGSRFIPPTNPIKSSIRMYNLSDEVFYLNLSSQFSTGSPPYVDLTSTPARMKYASEKGTVVLGGASKENAYLIGGVQQNLTILNEIDHNATITSNQTLMINEISKTYNATDQFVFFYQSHAKSWSYPLNQKGTPPSRRRSTSTTDPGKDSDLIDMNEYTNQSIRIQPRLAHTATLTPDNNEIIIIGGNSSNITNDLVPPVDLNPLIYILDIPCKTWVTTFTPGKSICSIESNSSNGLNIGEVVGITIA
ncbi:7595_t:CDS:2, partial [Racocetra fulgida]